MDIFEATRSFDRWMAAHIDVIKPDLAKKHERMTESAFVFLRATFYRWLQVFPRVCEVAASAPAVPSVGDLHLENFGTWRDREGRLVWGVNDVDEACMLPYTSDLVRLAASTVLAERDERSRTLSPRVICDALLDGYTASLARGGRPFVLAERRRWLRLIALSKLRDPVRFWPKLEALRSATGIIPHGLLRAALPDVRLPYRVLRRTAGVGSLGRSRVVALAEWGGGLIAREAKARLASAAVWATGRTSSAVDGAALLTRAKRMPDPCLTFHDRWVIRRLAPDCSRIELDDMPRMRGEERLVRAMGWEAANIHLGQRSTRIQADLKTRPRRWLERAALDMADAVDKDFRKWAKG